MRDAEERAAREMARGHVDLALRQLQDREAHIVCARFGIGERPVTYATLGMRLAVSRERVRQIFVRAMKKLARLDITAERLEQHAGRVERLPAPSPDAVADHG